MNLMCMHVSTDERKLKKITLTTAKKSYKMELQCETEVQRKYKKTPMKVNISLILLFFQFVSDLPH